MSMSTSEAAAQSSVEAESSRSSSRSVEKKTKKHKKCRSEVKANCDRTPAYVQVRTPTRESKKQHRKKYDPSKKEESELERYFIGSSRQRDAERLVEKGDFRLYYKLPEIEKCDLPIELKLHVVYRSSFDTNFHYPVITINDPLQGKRYRVLYGDPKSHSFGSIAELVMHHRMFSYRCATNDWFETFPVWQNSFIPDGHNSESICQ